MVKYTLKVWVCLDFTRNLKNWILYSGVINKILHFISFSCKVTRWRAIIATRPARPQPNRKLTGRFQPFALFWQNIWHYAPVLKLYRGVPLFRNSASEWSSYFNNSTTLKPSSRQVLATLALQRGFWAIKYSRVTVWNSAIGKPSYMQDKLGFWM